MGGEIVRKIIRICRGVNCNHQHWHFYCGAISLRKQVLWDARTPCQTFSMFEKIDQNATHYIALSNFDESDPILEFATQLKKSGDKENMEMAKKLYPKFRVFAPVVVRGEEDKGVRFYEFGKMVYQELLGVMADEDYGDITDIQNGRDITVEVIPAAETGKMFNTTTVRVKPNQTPLVEDAKKAEDLLENQKDVLSLFKKYTFEEMKDELQGWLKPSEEDGGKETEVKAAPSKTKKDIDSKLDELFD